MAQALLIDHIVNGNNPSRMELCFFALLKHFDLELVQFVFILIDIVYKPIHKCLIGGSVWEFVCHTDNNLVGRNEQSSHLVAIILLLWFVLKAT